MTEMEAKTVTVACIVTFEDYAKEQEMFEFENVYSTSQQNS